MRKKIQVFTVFCFVAFLCGMVAGAFFGEKKETSFYEKRSLAKKPQWSVSALMDGSYQNGLDQYLTDNALLRDLLLSGKTVLDAYILNRPVVNGVVVQEDILLPYLEKWDMNEAFRKDLTQATEEYVKTLARFNDQIEDYGGHFLYVGVPSHYAYNEDRYPWYLENRAEYTDLTVKAFTEAAAEEGVPFLDMGTVLEELGHPQWFRSATDHHYSFEGGYFTYRTILNHLNSQTGAQLSFPGEAAMTVKELPNVYMGSWSQMLYGMTGIGERLSIGLLHEELPFERWDNGQVSDPYIYMELVNDPEQLLFYETYMGGDIGHTKIDTNRPELPSVLIYGDSFTNLIECIAYYSFDEMESFDLRHYDEMPLSEYIAQTKPDYVICIRDYESLALNVDNGDVFGQNG